MNMIALATSTRPDRQTTVEAIRAAAEHIRQHGHPADGGPTITFALTQVAGTRNQVAAALADLQTAWGCPVNTWEAVHIADHEDGYDDAWTVAWHLDMAARKLVAARTLASVA